MSCTLIPGPRTWEMDRDEEGHRTFKVTHRVVSDTLLDGPSVVFNTPGLPLTGSLWNFGNDCDLWAFCLPTLSIRKVKQFAGHWDVDNTFSTKRKSNRCQDQGIENPLLEPQKVSGSFVKYTEEAHFDKDGKPLVTSAKERLRGPQVTFDANRPTVRIEQNVATLELALFTGMVDTVNGASMWGVNKRCVKLSNASWERKMYATCTFYYTRTFDFDINFNTFDREVCDCGTMAMGHWDADTKAWTVPAGYVVTNPFCITRYKDQRGENATAFLDGTGKVVDEGAAAKIKIEKYTESNFFQLGVPSSF